MNKSIYICAVTIFVLGFFIAQYYQVVTGQNDNILNTAISGSFLVSEKHPLNISEPIYQTITGNFLDTKELSTIPNLVTKESFVEHALMKDIGNVTNRMTFINTYDNSSGIIQGRGNGIIETSNNQSVGWISSDIGVVDKSGLVFHGIISFNNTNSDKLSFLNGKLGIYKDDPQIHRTIWLIN